MRASWKYEQYFFKIDRFVTMVCQHNYRNSGHYPSVLLLFKTTFCRINVVSVFRWNLLGWAQQTKAVSVADASEPVCGLNTILFIVYFV
jgi:hypothetical protein